MVARFVFVRESGANNGFILAANPTIQLCVTVWAAPSVLHRTPSLSRKLGDFPTAPVQKRVIFVQLTVPTVLKVEVMVAALPASGNFGASVFSHFLSSIRQEGQLSVIERRAEGGLFDRWRGRAEAMWSNSECCDLNWYGMAPRRQEQGLHHCFLTSSWPTHLTHLYIVSKSASTGTGRAMILTQPSNIGTNASVEGGRSFCDFSVSGIPSPPPSVKP
jgi:hypothetical protein